MPKPYNLLKFKEEEEEVGLKKFLVVLLGNSLVVLDVQLVPTGHIPLMALLALSVELTGTAQQGLKENGLGIGQTLMWVHS